MGAQVRQVMIERAKAAVKTFNEQSNVTGRGAVLLFSEGSVALMTMEQKTGCVSAFVRNDDRYLWDTMQAAFENNDIARAEGFQDVAEDDFTAMEHVMAGDVEFHHCFWG